ncbi:hypothetical protein D3C83_327430 [compost metagenome]
MSQSLRDRLVCTLMSSVHSGHASSRSARMAASTAKVPICSLASPSPPTMNQLVLTRPSSLAGK